MDRVQKRRTETEADRMNGEVLNNVPSARSKTCHSMIADFAVYQIKQLKKHCGTELNEEILDDIVAVLRDAACRYIDETDLFCNECREEKNLYIRKLIRQIANLLSVVEGMIAGIEEEI